MAPSGADRWEVPGPPDELASDRPGSGSTSLRPGVGEWLARRLGLSPVQLRLVGYLLAVAALGVVLMGLPGQKPPSPGPGGPGVGGSGGGVRSLPAATLSPAVPVEPAEVRTDLERELEAMLNLMEGVGNVKVLITYERGPEQVVAFNETREERVPAGAGSGSGSGGLERRTVRQAVLVRDADGRREVPVVLVERYPAVRGVMVVADGARNPAVRLAIQRAVAGALGVSPHRVVVGAKRR